MIEDLMAVPPYIFVLMTVRFSIRNNVFMFPHGTGRLENFLAFINAAMILPAAGFIFYSIINASLSQNTSIKCEYTQIVFVYCFVRLVLLRISSNRLIKKHKINSPILLGYDRNWKMSIIITLLSSASFLIALLFQKMNIHWVVILVDYSISFMIGSYMLYTALSVMKDNFASMIDLPLKESEQLKILGSLAKHFDKYSGLGTIFTRRCGSEKIIEVELSFPRDTGVQKVEELRRSIEEDLKADNFKEMTLNIYARPEKP
jgi:divalent metal cation (Fe/Co/Zn/Cd) transporter